MHFSQVFQLSRLGGRGEHKADWLNSDLCTLAVFFHVETCFGRIHDVATATGLESAIYFFVVYFVEVKRTE